VKANQLLLLLDGLDEVVPSALPACIEAINAYYHQTHRSLVVCSRTKEFLDQPGRLALHTAVTVQPLSSKQIASYLDGLAAKGEEIEGLKLALHQSATLNALATTPLFLTVLILAYHGEPVQELLALVKAAPTDQLHLLFHNYIEQSLQRKGTRIHAPAQQTRHWLAWLARQMTARNQSELYLEQFQQGWLPKRQRAFYRGSIRLAVGLLFGLTFGLVIGLVGGLAGGLAIGLFFGLFFGLLLGLIFGGIVRLDRKIVLAEALAWSWKGLAVGPAVGLLLGGAFGLGVGLDRGLTVGLTVGLVFGLLLGLPDGLLRKHLTKHSMLSPNEGIRRSIKNGLAVGLAVGLVGGLTVGLAGGVLFGLAVGLAVGPAVGLLFGLAVGLTFGLDAPMRHYTLRLWLWQARCTPAPWRYVAFLDDTVDQLLLRKVGGGYIFRHPLLQDYFASLDVVPPHDLSVRAEARSVLPNAPNGDPSV
jgi:hypothetical protein